MKGLYNSFHYPKDDKDFQNKFKALDRIKDKYAKMAIKLLVKFPKKYRRSVAMESCYCGYEIWKYISKLGIGKKYK